MNALEQIIEELADDGKSLAGPLLKTKVLGSRIKNQEIRDWATRELVGYREREDLPSYRFVRPAYHWIITQRGVELPQAIVPLMLFDDETRQRFFRGRMEDAVTVLESFTKRNAGDGFMRKDYAADICQFLTRTIIDNQQRNIKIRRLISTTDISEVVQVLAEIRSTLLGLMLELETDFPGLDKPLSRISAIGDTEQSRITQIFNNTIVTVIGSSNTVVTGDSNYVSPS